MSFTDRAFIAGVFEHPTRKAPDKSLAQLHAEVAAGALADAGLTLDDVDGYFVAGDNTNLYPLSLVEYLGLKLKVIGATDTGGSAYVTHVGQAMDAIAAGRCSVALITLAGRPRTGGAAADPAPDWSLPDVPFEHPYGRAVINTYAMCATRHMYEYGTTSEQLAWIKVAASHHAQHNPHAMLKNVVTVEDVVNSPMIADPLHRLDCCVVSDGGGAIVVVSPEVAKSLSRPMIRIRGVGDGVKHQDGGQIDLTYSATRFSAADAYARAGVTPSDIKYASLYDSFTITVLEQIEDLGFCDKGNGGAFVADGNLISGVGKLPINTDGGGLCNNHPANRGGMTKVIEAVRQLRGEAHAAVQVANCDLALANATGGWLGTRHAASTVILERL
jgi:acetyl-CoA C-acetyltransferase